MIVEAAFGLAAEPAGFDLRRLVHRRTADVGVWGQFRYGRTDTLGRCHLFIGQLDHKTCAIFTWAYPDFFPKMMSKRMGASETCCQRDRLHTRVALTQQTLRLADTFGRDPIPWGLSCGFGKPAQKCSHAHPGFMCHPFDAPVGRKIGTYAVKKRGDFQPFPDRNRPFKKLCLSPRPVRGHHETSGD